MHSVCEMRVYVLTSCFRSDDSSVSLSYYLDLVSDTLANFSVFVEDEFTYFANGTPPVRQANVQIWNHSPGLKRINEQKATNDSGLVTFQNIPEGFYNILVSEENHGSFRATIPINPSRMAPYIVFLPRVKVRVNFVVERIEIQEEYRIVLESSFIAKVPMPVVTMRTMDNKMEVDLDLLEEGYVDMVPFKVSESGLCRVTVKYFDLFQVQNHGLIAADNVNMNPPSGHPFLTFTMEPQVIERLPAKSTFTVKMDVHRIREKVIHLDTGFLLLCRAVSRD